jgi:hypothetical protein
VTSRKVMCGAVIDFIYGPNNAPKWLRTEEVLGEFASARAFHQFVLEGNEKAIAEFYTKRRQGPVLGEEHFRDVLGSLRVLVGSIPVTNGLSCDRLQIQFSRH